MTRQDRDAGAPPSQPLAKPPFGVDRGDRVHEFRAGQITVTWSRKRCTHVAACVMNLPRVFAPGRRPWVDAEQAPADAVARVVPHCPTGALHFTRADGDAGEPMPATNTVVVTRNGPLHVRGNLEIFDESGARRLSDTRAALCRCGRSANRPFCDGSHAAGFRDEGPVHPRTLPPPGDEPAALRVMPEPGGPLRLNGPLMLTSADRRTVIIGDGAVLCRCGGSQTKPFCDGTHRQSQE